LFTCKYSYRLVGVDDELGFALSASVRATLPMLSHAVEVVHVIAGRAFGAIVGVNLGNLALQLLRDFLCRAGRVGTNLACYCFPLCAVMVAWREGVRNLVKNRIAYVFLFEVLRPILGQLDRHRLAILVMARIKRILASIKLKLHVVKSMLVHKVSGECACFAHFHNLSIPHLHEKRVRKTGR